MIFTLLPILFALPSFLNIPFGDFYGYFKYYWMTAGPYLYGASVIILSLRFKDDIYHKTSLKLSAIWMIIITLLNLFRQGNNYFFTNVLISLFIYTIIAFLIIFADTIKIELKKDGKADN